MINFQPVTINDKDIIQPFFSKSTFRNCDYSFTNIFSWCHYYHTTFAVEDGYLFIRFHSQGESAGYLFPLGGDDLKFAIGRIMRDAERRNEPFNLFAITEKMFEQIEAAFPGQFQYEKERAWYEYIYSAEDLITLRGKKFQSKRNHINKFNRTYQYEYLSITRKIIPECMELYKRWCRENGGCKTEESLIAEGIATENVFNNYEKLDIRGGALRINGEILAYSYGQPLTADTFGVHAEKSLYEIDGGFTMMNQQFAEHECANYLYINREEDLGLDSLRQAKMSYQPVILLEKGSVTPIL